MTVEATRHPPGKCIVISPALAAAMSILALGRPAPRDTTPFTVCFESGELFGREPGKCPVHIRSLGQRGGLGQVERAHWCTLLVSEPGC